MRIAGSLIFLVFVAAAAANSFPLLDYQALLTSLWSGNNVRVIVNAQECKFDQKQQDTPMPFIGGATIPTFGILLENNTLIFDNCPLVTVPTFGLLLNNVHYEVHSDHTVRLVSTLLEPATYRQISQTVINCRFSATAYPVHGVAFFQTS